MKLHELKNGKLFLTFRIVPRILLFVFGVGLVLDDVFWHNISVGSIYSLGGFHIHHSMIGFLLILAAGISLFFIGAEMIEKEPS